MSALVLDSGALIAVDRGDRHMVRRICAAQRSGTDLRTTGAVIAEVWRDPRGRQARLASLLAGVDVRAVDEELGKAAGVLIGRAGAGDAAEATAVAVAASGDRVLTADAADVRRLVAASGRAVLVVGC